MLDFQQQMEIPVLGAGVEVCHGLFCIGMKRCAQVGLSNSTSYVLTKQPSPFYMWKDYKCQLYGRKKVETCLLLHLGKKSNNLHITINCSFLKNVHGFSVGEGIHLTMLVNEVFCLTTIKLQQGKVLMHWHASHLI